MIIGDRGQVTVPKKLRERFGLHPRTEVEFVVVNGQLLLRRNVKPQKTTIARWVGFLEGQPEDVDTFIEEIRGR